MGGPSIQKTTIVLLTIIAMFAVGCSIGSDNPVQLTVRADIETSAAQESLATIALTNEIVLTFNDYLNVDSIAGNVNLNIVKTDQNLESNTFALQITVDEEDLRRLRLQTADGNPLPSGEEYELVVNTGVKALSGITLPETYVRYFATDYNFSLGSIPELGTDRTITVVISDIHMGDSRSITQGYGWFINNRDKFRFFWALNNYRFRPLYHHLPSVGFSDMHARNRAEGINDHAICDASGCIRPLLACN